MTNFLTDPNMPPLINPIKQETDPDIIREILRPCLWDLKMDPWEMYEYLYELKEGDQWFNKDWAFARMLATLPWYTLIRVVPVEQVAERITPGVLQRLWPKSLRESYERLKRILSGEVVPFAGWHSESDEKLGAAIFSDRRYSTEQILF